MPRFAAFLMVLVLLAGSAMGAALAQEQPAAAPRYVFVPVETGALRLHTGTGEVSLCEGGNGAGACTALADERSAAGSVAADMAELEKRVAALEARVAELEAGGATLHDAEAMDRVAILAERIMRRFFAMVRDLKEESQREDL